MNNTITDQFDWIEYSVFSFVLTLSSGIGIYFGCIKGGQNTVSGYLLGGKQMSVFPIAMSLTTSFISGITLLGVPTEVYTFGTQYLAFFISNCFVGITTAFIMLPVYYKLQIISLYEYIEMRFGHKARLVMSFMYSFSLLGYVPLLVYGPALALNQVSGMSLHLITPIICFICIFYTTLGGLKAVAWSDALQGIIMLGSICAVIFFGVHKVGGFGAVLEAAIDGERIEFFNMNPDPTLRLTFWSCNIGIYFYWLSMFSVNPATVQRFIALPTYRQAQISIIFVTIGTTAYIWLSGLIGLIIYANYKDCDPLTSKVIEKPDQILPYFVLNVVGSIKGLPGLFIAGIVCAALSSMSTSLNTVAGTFYEDFIEPLLSKKPNENKASLILKMLVIIFGVICILLVNVVEKLGHMIEISIGVGGVTNSAMLGIFVLGLLFPWANTKGAMCGGIVSMISMIWILVGTTLAKRGGLIKHPTKPLSVENCTFDINKEQISSITDTEEMYVFPIYKLSIFYYSTLGFFIVIIVGLAVSFLTGPNDPSDVHPDLISPIAQRFLPKRTKYDVVLLKVVKPKHTSE